MFQLCPDQPCGAAKTVGNGIVLPAVADATQQAAPCIAFSIGVDADEVNSITDNDCKGDLIRINGEETSSLSFLNMFQKLFTVSIIYCTRFLN